MLCLVPSPAAAGRHGASHQRMERIREHVGQLCRGWPAERVRDIVTRHLDELIPPYIYDEARALLSRHHAAGEDVIIVSTSGQEMVGPIGALLGAALVIATRMEIAEGCYTGADRVLRLRRGQGAAGPGTGRGTRLPASRLLRLQRLGHRPAHAGGGRPAARGEPGPGAAPAGPAARLAGAGVPRAALGRAAPARPLSSPAADLADRAAQECDSADRSR